MPDNPEAYRLLADFYFASGDITSALTEYVASQKRKSKARARAPAPHSNDCNFSLLRESHLRGRLFVHRQPHGITNRYAQVQRHYAPRVAEVAPCGGRGVCVPALQQPLLKAGLGFSDWASARLFRSGRLATTFSDSEADARLKNFHQWLRRG